MLILDLFIAESSDPEPFPLDLENVGHHKTYYSITGKNQYQADQGIVDYLFGGIYLVALPG